MTTIFLIRGFRLGTTAADEDFTSIRNLFQERGYKVVPVNWTWNYLTMSQYIAKFKLLYFKNKSDNNIIVGHSFGALAALASASELSPDLVIACSLSACFKEDLPFYEGTEEPINRIGVRRLKDFSNISAEKVTQDINRANFRVAILYGEQEKQHYPLLVNRCIATAQSLKNSSLTEIKYADHSIYSSEYMNAIQKSLDMYV